MPYQKLVLTLLLIAYLGAPNVLAQADGEGKRRWTVRTFFILPESWTDFNSRGLVSFLENNGFDDAQSLLGRTLENPVVWTRDGSWCLYAAYALRPRLSVGGLYYKAQDVAVAGLRNEAPQEVAFHIHLDQTMWALAPIAIWKPVTFVNLGVGPAFIRGGTAPYEAASQQRVESQARSFQRLGAVIFISLGFTTFNQYLYLGLQGQFFYGGTVEMGPFEAEEWIAINPPHETFTLEAQNARIDQLTWGPVIAINF